MLQPNIGSYMWTEDHTEVDRRALVYVLAVREWQLRHDGRFPEKLEELAPDVLPTLPTDPYSGGLFGYNTLELARRMTPNAPWQFTEWPRESRLIYSVGDDRVDRGGLYSPNAGQGRDGDIVFPVFPAASKTETR
jgi:hypothetical protein